MRSAFVALLLIATAASAECKKADFNRYVAAAVRLYEALEYERALDQFGKAKESACGVDDDALLGLYEGIVRSDLGQGEQAKAAFKEALLLKPDADLPLRVSPKVKKLVEVLRADAKKELAPILARQEAERQKKLAEEAKRADEARRVEEQKRAEDARRADEQRRVADAARSDEQRRQDDARRLDEQRRADEAARRANPDKPPQVIVIEKPTSDRPEQRELTASPSATGDDVASAVKTEVKQQRSVPVVSIVFGGAALAAGGVGAYFGVTSKQLGEQALAMNMDQARRNALVGNANTNALLADVLFGVAGAAAIGAVIALFATPNEPISEAPK